MTVAAETPINTYTANGSTTVFAYTFRVEDASEIKIYHDEVEQASGFTLSGIGSNGGGSVTYTTAPASGTVILFLREMPTTRTIDYQNSGDFRSGTINEDIDRVWLKLQQVERELSYRVLQFAKPEQRTPSQNALPSPAAGMALVWETDGSIANSALSYSLNSSAIIASDYSALRSLDSSVLDDGTLIWVLGHPFPWEVKTGTVTDDGNYLVFSDDSNRYAENSGLIKLLKTFGAEGDGTTDDRTSLAAADSFGGCTLTAGTYSIQSNITLNGDYIFEPGAILKPANGVTITFGAGSNYKASKAQCFDVSVGGDFDVAAGHQIDEIETIHFGGTSNTETEVAADTNMLAIKSALNMAGSLGVPGGIYRQPSVRLSVGRWFVDDDDADGTGAIVHSYTTFKGYGDSSVIVVRSSAHAFNVLAVNENGANSVIIDDMQIDGQYASQSNTQHGIVVNPASSPCIYSVIGKGMYIKEMNGNNILIDSAGMDSSEVEPKICRDSSLSCLKITACDKLKIRGSYRSAKTTYHGIEAEGSGVEELIIDAQCGENGGDGIYLKDTQNESRQQIKGGCSIEENGGRGLYAENTTRLHVGPADFKQGTLAAIYIKDCSKACIDGANIYAPKRQGVVLDNSNDGRVSAFVDAASDTNDGVYDAIVLFNSDNNHITNCTVRQGATYQTRYALAVDDAGCSANLVYGNDLEQGDTGGLLDNGTSTDTSSVNKIR